MSTEVQKNEKKIKLRDDIVHSSSQSETVLDFAC